MDFLEHNEPKLSCCRRCAWSISIPAYKINKGLSSPVTTICNMSRTRRKRLTIFIYRKCGRKSWCLSRLLDIVHSFLKMSLEKLIRFKQVTGLGFWWFDCNRKIMVCLFSWEMWLCRFFCSLNFFSLTIYSENQIEFIILH